MKSFRNPKYLERYEDVVFDLERALPAAAVGQPQKRENLRFIVDNTGEVTPLDWYNARVSLDFKVVKNDNTDIAIDDGNGIVNGSFSLIKHLEVKTNGKKVYDCDNASHCVNIKKLLEYTPMYSNSVATNEFYFLDTSTNAQAVRYTRRTVTHGRNDQNAEAADYVYNFNADYNQGYSVRKALLGAHVDTVVNTEIPLNRYSFFESLENKLLPNSRVDLDLKIESDNNLINLENRRCCV